ncbi:MAG: GAF domain-containing protein [Bacteroidota bacterium]
MQISIKIIRWAVITAFVIAAGVTTYLLFQLPDLMPLYSPALDLSAVEQLNPLLYQVYVAVGATILLGLGAITIMVNSKGQQSNIQVAEFQVSEQELTDSDETTKESKADEFYLGDAEELLSLETETGAVFSRALSQVCETLEASQGAVYQIVEEEENKVIELFASYAYHIPEGDTLSFRWGEGLIGQSAKEGKVLNIDNVPEGYIQIFSGLGKATPKHLLVLPMKEGEDIVGMVELSSFKQFQENHILALEQYFGKLALKLSNNDNVSLEAAKS